MSRTILPQSKCPASQQALILNFDDQVTCKALMLRMFEESRELGERSIRGSSAHRIAVNMFNLLVAMNGVLNTSDEVLTPAHELKIQMQ